MSTTASWTTLLANETLSTLMPNSDAFPYDGQPFFQVKLAYISVLVFFGAFICSGGGIGGGGVFVPSFMLGLRLVGALGAAAVAGDDSGRRARLGDVSPATAAPDARIAD
jgi:hypothetical protein